MSLYLSLKRERTNIIISIKTFLLIDHKTVDDESIQTAQNGKSLSGANPIKGLQKGSISSKFFDWALGVVHK